MRDLSSLNEWRVDHGDYVLPFFTSYVVDSGLSPLPVRLTGPSFQLGLGP